MKAARRATDFKSHDHLPLEHFFKVVDRYAEVLGVSGCLGG